jgi:S1-C subfamily serine protease
LKPVASGSGFFVSRDGHVITNAHVVRGCTEMRSPGLSSLTVVAMDEQSDLALLQADKKSGPFVKLRGGRGDKLGESVVAVGFPLLGILGSNPIVTTGVISSLSGLGNDRRKIQISAPVQPGNSGGPVIGADGALVGVVESMLDDNLIAQITDGQIPQNVNFAVSLGTLQSFLNANGVPYVLTDGGPKKSASDISEAASGYTLVLECWK